MYFLRFWPWIRFICERSAENEKMLFRFIYMWNGPLIDTKCVKWWIKKHTQFLQWPSALSVTPVYLPLYMSGYVLTNAKLSKLINFDQSRGQKYFNIVLVLQDEWHTIFARPANTCTCPKKSVCNKEHKRVICNTISSSYSFQSTHPTGRVLLEELLVLSRFHS